MNITQTRASNRPAYTVEEESANIQKVIQEALKPQIKKCKTKQKKHAKKHNLQEVNLLLQERQNLLEEIEQRDEDKKSKNADDPKKH